MLSRRELLRRGAAIAGPALMLGRVPGAEAAASRPTVAGMNVIIFITDQQRHQQHFPPGWSKRNLPGFSRLQAHGLTFENAFCSASMCSPSRASLLTGYFPAQHGVKYTLEDNMPDDEYPQVELSTSFKNIATVMAAAGYNVVYKGKWHASKPTGSEFTPQDLERYGFQRWNPPDAGANQDVEQEGGGEYDNDGRFMNGTGTPDSGDEGVLSYLSTAAAGQQPFCLIISLVNPHDVLLYPKTYSDGGGYDESWLQGEIGLPETVDEDLSTKPSAQRQFRALLNLIGPLTGTQQKRNYLNFYGNLMKLADQYLVDVLDTLTEQNMLENTLIIQTSDHGEMGLAHGGLRQKCFNFYEETLNVPLVYSNPRLWSRPKTTQALVSHVDLLPTLASLVNAPASARADWQGVDYSGVVLGKLAPPAQDHVVFTYDDWMVGQASGPYVQPPQHIVSLREHRWKLAEYYDADGHKPSQWEMYDLRSDPLEQTNLADSSYRRTPEQEQQYLRLRSKLARVKLQRLAPLKHTPRPRTIGDPSRKAPVQSLD